MTEKTCSNCKHYKEFKEYNMPEMICYGPAADHVKAYADDDSGLCSTFSPPETFSCNGWEKKD